MLLTRFGLGVVIKSKMLLDRGHVTTLANSYKTFQEELEKIYVISSGGWFWCRPWIPIDVSKIKISTNYDIWPLFMKDGG